MYVHRMMLISSINFSLTQFKRSSTPATLVQGIIQEEGQEEVAKSKVQMSNETSHNQIK